MSAHAVASYLFAAVVVLNHRLALSLSLADLCLVGAVLGAHLSKKFLEAFRELKTP